jgi:hypothetical protein
MRGPVPQQAVAYEPADRTAAHAPVRRGQRTRANFDDATALAG